MSVSFWHGNLAAAATLPPNSPAATGPVDEVSERGDLGAAPGLEDVQFVSERPRTTGAWTVVEVWATWCGACRKSFSQLTDLQQRYGSRVRVLALTDEPVQQVRSFYRANEGDMGFAVAVTSSDVLGQFLFGGFGGRGIPSVYLIHSDRLVWGGAVEELPAAMQRHVGPPSPSVTSPGSPESPPKNPRVR